MSDFEPVKRFIILAQIRQAVGRSRSGKFLVLVSFLRSKKIVAVIVIVVVVAAIVVMANEKLSRSKQCLVAASAIECEFLENKRDVFVVVGEGNCFGDGLRWTCHGSEVENDVGLLLLLFLHLVVVVVVVGYIFWKILYTS